jgi:uncharacterized protein YndB with AHSA1/START domain
MSRNTTTLIAEPGKQELFVIREFDAPREQIFKAFVNPELYVQWILGPRRMGLTMRLEKFEPRTGGAWRYVQKDKDGNEYGFHGSYHEVQAPERIIDTFEFEGLSERGHASLETAKFDVLPSGRTRLTIHSVFQSVVDRDGMIQAGMEEGLRDSFDRLDALLADRPSN